MNLWRRLTGHRAPEKQAEYENLERAAVAARQHRERSQTRLDESRSRVRDLLESFDRDENSEPRHRGGHAD